MEIQGLYVLYVFRDFYEEESAEEPACLFFQAFSFSQYLLL